MIEKHKVGNIGQKIGQEPTFEEIDRAAAEFYSEFWDCAGVYWQCMDERERNDYRHAMRAALKTLSNSEHGR